MDALDTIEPTLISHRIWIEPTRKHRPQVLEDLARWINTARQIVQPSNIDHLRTRFNDHTPETLLQEISTIAQNIVGTLPMPFPSNLHPTHVIDDNNNFLWAGINGRDHKKAAQIALVHIREMLDAASTQNEHLPHGYVAIALAEFQNRLHNFLEGTGRASRILALIYWPDDFHVTAKDIERILTGSTSIQDNFRSFSDPSINLINVFESLMLADHVDPTTHLPQTYTIGSFQQVFKSYPELGKYIDDAVGVYESQRILATVSLYSEYFGVTPQQALLEGILPRGREIPFSEREQEANLFHSDIHECAIVTSWQAGGYTILKEFVERNTEGLPPTYAATIASIAQCSRDVRLAFLDGVLRSVHDKTIIAEQLHDQPAIADVLEAQYEDGINWVTKGLNPSESYSNLRTRTYPENRMFIQPPIEPRTIGRPPTSRG